MQGQTVGKTMTFPPCNLIMKHNAPGTLPQLQGQCIVQIQARSPPQAGKLWLQMTVT